MDNVPMTTPGPVRKALYLGIGIVCLTLGILGLLIPVIPGLVFLAIALVLLSRSSRRIHQFAARDPRFLALSRRLTRLANVGGLDRLRVGGWMVLDAFVQSAAATAALLRRAIHRR